MHIEDREGADGRPIRSQIRDSTWILFSRPNYRLRSCLGPLVAEGIIVDPLINGRR